MEALLEELGLNIDEERLLMDIIIDRLENEIRRMKTNDYLGGLSGGVFSSLLKKSKKAVEEE